MNKPNNYDETKVGDFERVTVGPHIAVIKAVEEKRSAKDQEMIVVSIDFSAPEDAQAGYFKKQFDNDTRDDKKWPFQATSYILTLNSEGKTNRSFKSFCTAFEDSNGCKIKWGDDFGKQFKGKKIGVMYGEVEEEYNGQIQMRTRIRWFFDLHKIDSQSAPLAKLLPKTENAAVASADWMNIPETDQEALPF